MTDSTLSGNQDGQGGSSVNPCAGQARNGEGAGIATSGGTATISYSTIADNTDGIDNLGGTVTADGTIVADSTLDNCAGAISETPGNHNLDSGTSCGFDATGDLSDTDPQLGALQGNGGLTDTQALVAGSPAIDVGGNRAEGCPSTDQRESRARTRRPTTAPATSAPSRARTCPERRRLAGEGARGQPVDRPRG